MNDAEYIGLQHLLKTTWYKIDNAMNGYNFHSSIVDTTARNNIDKFTCKGDRRTMMNALTSLTLLIIEYRDISDRLDAIEETPNE